MFPDALLANIPGVDEQLFWIAGASWDAWHKPIGRHMACIVAIGGGAGGGGGASGNTGGGGGGRQRGQHNVASSRWSVLPDLLYVQVATGGGGGTAAGGGSGGNTTYVSIDRGTTSASLVLYANNGNAGGAGGAGAGRPGLPRARL